MLGILCADRWLSSSEHLTTAISIPATMKGAPKQAEKVAWARLGLQRSVFPWDKHRFVMAN